jgi:1-acyl-sn-glycerol-3-phosphate acyltransferase
MENIPSTACIIASKHLSALETLTFHYIFYQPVYILKQELTKLPLCGMYFIKMGMVIVDRKAGASALKKMLRDSIAKLQSGKNIIIFPEGTRTLIGQRLPYQTGIAALYSQANVPVVPTALNTGLFWSKKSFYIKPGTYIIEFLPPIYPGLNKTELMTTLEEKIETGSEKLILGANNAR